MQVHSLGLNPLTFIFLGSHLATMSEPVARGTPNVYTVHMRGYRGLLPCFHPPLEVLPGVRGTYWVPCSFL